MGAIGDLYPAAHNLLRIALQKTFVTKLQQFISVHQHKWFVFVIGDSPVSPIEMYGFGVNSQ
jgi:hypothetical protein